MRKDDDVRLRHMLDHSKQAIEYSKGKTRRDLDTNELLASALEYNIIIIGEAAVNVSKRCQEDNPTIRWRDISSMRERLVHMTYPTDPDLIWATIEKDLPSLISELEKIISLEKKC